MAEHSYSSNYLSPKARYRLRVILILFVYLALYVLMDRFSLTLQTSPGVVAWYPPDGLSFALLLVFGVRFFPIVALASFISSIFIYQFSAPPAALAGWALALSLTYSLAAELLRRGPFDLRLRNARDLAWLILSAAVVSAILAYVSISASMANGIIPEDVRFPAMAHWWLGEMTGVLTFTPFLLIHVAPWMRRFVDGEAQTGVTARQRLSFKIVAPAITLLALVYAVLALDWPTDYPPLFLSVLPLVWIAIEFGLSGISLAILTVNCEATLLFLLFHRIDASQFGQSQLQFLVISVASLLNGSIIMEYRRSQNEPSRTATEEMRQRQMRIVRELLIIFFSALAVWVLEYTVDFYESVTEWERRIGLKGLDETLMMVMFLGVALAVFSYRRWKEIQTEAKERQKAEAALSALNRQLEQRVLERTADLSKANRLLKDEIAERQHAEEALRQCELRFRALIENNADAITLLDASGSVIYDSPSAPGMLGYGAEEWIGRSVFELLHPEDAPGTIHRFQSVTETPGARANATFRVRRQDGSWLWIEAVATNLLDEPGVMAVVVNYRDITMRKQAEEALATSEDRYRDLVENSHDLICTHDLEGRVLSVNPHAEQALGYPNGALLNANIADFLDPSTRDHFDVYLARVREHGIAEGDMIVLTAKGDRRIWEYRNTLRTEGVAEPIVRGMARDVTEQRQAEEEVLNLSRFPAENPSPVMRFALDCSLLYTNKAGSVLLDGWTQQGYQTIPDELQAHIRQAAEKGENVEVELAVAERIYSCILAPIPEIGYVNFYGHDVTDRKQAEAALRESEAHFRSLFENMPISIWEEDFSAVKVYLDSLKDAYADDPAQYFDNHPEVVQRCASLVNVVDVNWASLELHEASSKAQLIGNIEQTFTQESYLAFQHELVMIINGATRSTFDANVKTLTGKHRMVTINWAVFPGYEANLSRVMVSLVDITDRKQAEEEATNRTSELLTLYGLSRALAGVDDLHEILGVVNRHAVESIHVTLSQIALLEGDRLVVRSAHPARALDHVHLTGKDAPIAELPYLRKIFDHDEPVVLQAGDPELNPGERAFLLLDAMQTVCLTPLRIGRPDPHSRHIQGLLVLGEARKEEREPFTPGKLRLAQSIGNQAAVAIRRTLLREQTERRLQQLGALREIDQAIASSVSLRLSAGVLLWHVLEQLGAHAAALWVLNPETKMLELQGGRGFLSFSFQKAHPLKLGEGYAGRAASERRMIHITDLANQPDNPRLQQALKNEMFVSYYGVPLVAKGGVMGVLEVFHRTAFEPDEDWLDFFNTLAGQGAIAIDNVRLFENLQRSNEDLFLAYDKTLEGWSAALDLRDEETEGHTQRVTEMTVRLAQRMGLGEQELTNVRRGALLHDIGKMGIPDRILLKPGKLTEEEWKVMRQHPVYAYNLISPIAYLRPALDIPYCHHEKWDGTGYPRGLKGQKIPLAARIFSIVDVWDALRSDRPYRAAWPQDKVLAYLQEQSGSHFDPEVVEAFMALMREDSA